MDLLDKFRPVADALAAANGSNPFDVVVERVVGATEVIIEGRLTQMFGSNNYLGLSLEPAVLQAAAQGLRDWGAGTTGSRVANGTLAVHRAFEARLAQVFALPQASLFTTGHQANLSVIAGLCGVDDVLLLDAESHASIFDAARLSGATTIVFRHNDPNDLSKKLRRLPAGATNRLVAVEGLYSTSGDVAPLADLRQVSADGGAYLLVDEAHSFGVYGAKGLGCAEDQGLGSEVDFIVGTFSKSLAGVGGFCVSRHEALALLRYTARAYLFTASSSAATVCAAAAALDAVLSRPALRTRLWRNTGRLREGLVRRGFTLGPSASPIVAIHTADAARTLRMWRALLDEGVYVNVVLPPACANNAARLRMSCTAAHEDDDIDRALAAFDRASGRVKEA